MTGNSLTAAAVDRTDANLSEAHADVKTEIARTDTKAGLLLAFIGAALAGVWTVATGMRLPLATVVVGSIGAAVLGAAAAVLLGVVRPQLGGSDRASFPYWARLSPERLSAEMVEDRRAQAIAVLSRIAVRKMRGLQRAVDLTRTAGVLFAVAALLAVLGGGR